jgi:predicted nucleic acid-binding protein
MKVLIDTCIIIDLLQKREPFFNDAYDVFMAAARNQIDGYITAKSSSDIFYLMHKVFHDLQKTRDALAKLMKLFEVLDTTASDCQLAILSPISDFEDALMDETAFRTGMNFIVTRNIRDFKNSTVQVCHPQEFLEKLYDA